MLPHPEQLDFPIRSEVVWTYADGTQKVEPHRPWLDVGVGVLAGLFLGAALTLITLGPT